MILIAFLAVTFGWVLRGEYNARRPRAPALRTELDRALVDRVFRREP